MARIYHQPARLGAVESVAALFAASSSGIQHNVLLHNVFPPRSEEETVKANADVESWKQLLQKTGVRRLQLRLFSDEHVTHSHRQVFQRGTQRLLDGMQFLPLGSHGRDMLGQPRLRDDAQLVDTATVRSMAESVVLARNASSDTTVLLLGDVGVWGSRRIPDACRQLAALSDSDCARNTGTFSCEEALAAALLCETLLSTMRDVVVVGQAVCLADGPFSEDGLGQTRPFHNEAVPWRAVMYDCKHGALLLSRTLPEHTIHPASGNHLVRFESEEGLPPHRSRRGAYFSRPGISAKEVMFVPRDLLSRLLPNPVQRIAARGDRLQLGLSNALLEFVWSPAKGVDPDRLDDVVRLRRHLEGASFWVHPNLSTDWLPPDVRLEESAWRQIYDTVLSPRPDENSARRAVFRTEPSAREHVYAGPFHGVTSNTIIVPYALSLFVPLFAPLLEVLADAGIAAALTRPSPSFALVSRPSAYLFCRYQDWEAVGDVSGTPYIAWNMEDTDELFQKQAFQAFMGNASVRFDYTHETTLGWYHQVASPFREADVMATGLSMKSAQDARVLYLPFCYHPALNVTRGRPAPDINSVAVAASHFGSQHWYTPRRNEVLRLVQSLLEGKDIRPEKPSVANHAELNETVQRVVSTTSRDLRIPRGLHRGGRSPNQFFFGAGLREQTAVAPVTLNLHTRAPPGAAALERSRIVPFTTWGEAVIISERGRARDRPFEDLIGPADGAKGHIFVAGNGSVEEVAVEIAKWIVHFTKDERGRSEARRRAAWAQHRLRDHYRCDELAPLRRARDEIAQLLPEWYGITVA